MNKDHYCRNGDGKPGNGKRGNLKNKHKNKNGHTGKIRRKRKSDKKKSYVQLTQCSVYVIIFLSFNDTLIGGFSKTGNV